MRDIKIHRPTLGPYMSVLCFRYLSDDAEELAGHALIIDAGRQRGHDLIEELGLQKSSRDAQYIQEHLDKFLGEDGTRLCLVNQVKEKEGGGYEVYTSDNAHAVYTLGVLIGAISAMTGLTMLGKESEKTQQDASEGVYFIEPL